MSRDAAERLAGLLARQRHVSVALGRLVEERTGLTAVQAAAALAVGDGARRASEVAEQTHQHASGASRVIESLVQAGLVDRETDPEDRRAVVLSLTAEGRERARAVVDCYRETLAAILEAMDGADADRYVAATESFLDAADAVLDGS